MLRLPMLAVLATFLGLFAPAGQAELVRYHATLEPESLGATGSGSVTVLYDALAHTLQVSATWSGLSGTTTVAHIHCCTAAPGTGTVGVAVTPVTLPGFPVGISAGAYASPLLDLTSAFTFTPAFVTNFAGGVLGNAEDALIAGFDAGLAYFNIHSTAFPPGEIRGFLQEVPEPGTLALAALGLAALARHRTRTGRAAGPAAHGHGVG